MKNLEKELAKELFEIKAFFYRPEEPFLWASGIKSPVYCDNRLTLSFPNVRNKIVKGLINIIKENYSDVEMIIGTITAGIPHAALVAQEMKLPMGYARGYAKNHGRKNKIEGNLSKGLNVVVVEDLISTGGSVLEVVKALREEGLNVLGVVSIYTYNLESAVKNFKDYNVKNISLTNFDAVMEIAKEYNYISDEDIKKIVAFRKNPTDESWIA